LPNDPVIKPPKKQLANAAHPHGHKKPLHTATPEGENPDFNPVSAGPGDKSAAPLKTSPKNLN
jgi:hypothetical protein